MYVIYVPYMYMASIWEIYGFHGQFLQHIWDFQGTYMGLSIDI